MRDFFDVTTIILLALAVFIFLRLRSVLGQRTGASGRPMIRIRRAMRCAPRPTTTS
jgi:hypothetical protein